MTVIDNRVFHGNLYASYLRLYEHKTCFSLETSQENILCFNIIRDILSNK